MEISLSTYVDYITLKPVSAAFAVFPRLSTYVDYITLKPNHQQRRCHLVLVPM